MIKIKNATLISMSDKREKIENNIDILIDNNKIIKIGKNIDYIVDKEIDATGKIVMPGLINTHCHVPMSIFKESVDGYLLQDWLTKVIWPMEDKLTREDIYYASLLSFIEMIKTGTTTVNDMYFMTDDIIKAALDTNFRLQTTRTLMCTKPIEEELYRLDELKELINKYKDNNLITFNAGVHGLYTTNREYIKKCSEFSKQNDLLIHIHFCENEKEVSDIKNIYNEEPVDILLNEFKDNKLLLAHSVKLTNLDILKLSSINSVSISHCPISNLKLGCGIAKISEIFNKGINVTLGTDGQGSGCNLDLFEVMKYTGLLQKGINENPLLLPSYEILKMATINAARALNLDNIVGSIEEGKCADLIILDMNNVIVQPINDIYSDIVYNAKGSNVDTTIINGKVVMENRILNLNIKEDYIFKKSKEIIDRVSK